MLGSPSRRKLGVGLLDGVGGGDIVHSLFNNNGDTLDPLDLKWVKTVGSVWLRLLAYEDEVLREEGGGEDSGDVLCGAEGWECVVHYNTAHIKFTLQCVENKGKETEIETEKEEEGKEKEEDGAGGVPFLDECRGWLAQFSMGFQIRGRHVVLPVRVGCRG